MYPPLSGLAPQVDIPGRPRPLGRGRNSGLRWTAFGSTLLVIAAMMAGTVAAAPAHAATPKTIISLTFDDSNADQVAAAATMASLGLHGTFYTVSGWLGQPDYMTVADLQQLVADGNEIGGHTVNHPDLATLPAAEATREICNDRVALTNLGFQVTSFAYPFASFTSATEAIVKGCGYNSARALGDLAGGTDPQSVGEPAAGPIPPADPYDLAAPSEVDSTWTLADLQASVTNAEAAGGGWVPLTFHHINVGTDPTLTISPDLFTQFVTWLAAQQTAGNVSVQTVNQVIGGTVQPAVPGPAAPPPPPEGTNMITNPGLETLTNGLPECWAAGSYGTNTPTFAIVSPGHSGTNAEELDMTGYSSGDAKLLPALDTGTCSPAGTPGHVYTLSAWYKSTALTQFEVYYRLASGTWDYWTASPQYAASSDWTQVTWTTPALPAGASGVSWGLNIQANGTITTDDYSMIDSTNLAAFTTSPVPTITGLTVSGQLLTAVPGTWAPAPDTLTYQWNSNGVAITGATNSTYTLASTDVGKTITVTVTGTKAGYVTTSQTSAATAAITAPAAFTTAPIPTITGSAVSGQLLTAVPGTWAPAPDTLTYQWNDNGVAITGATNNTYTLASTDVGQAVTVTVTGTKAGYTTTSMTSTATATVTAPFTTTPTPTITGLPVSGQLLTAVPGTWDPAPDTLTYQWNSNGTAITGATNNTYTPTNTDIGNTITVTVTGTKTGYATTSVTSTATTAITAPAAFTTTPTPTITGSAVSGQLLTANPGTWAPAPDTLTYQWNSNGTAITGATNNTYTPASTDVGKTITVTVTGTKAGYVTTSQTSAATTAVTGPAPLAFTTTPTPTITGQAISGQLLTAVPGTWTPAPDTLTYQWNSNGTAITGAKASTYTLASTDVGKTITVTVTGTKTGYITTTKTSTATATVTTPAAKPLTATPTPTITGLAITGQKLTANPGTWAPAPVTLTYQWKRNGVAITGATASTYTLTSTDIGKTITITVTGTKTGYTTTTKTSAAVTPVAATSAVTRLAGADRYATSAAISKATFSPGVSIAYVASGAVFPDALSGAAAAAKTGSPVLLAASNGITPDVKAELTRLKPKKIVVLGGTGVLSDNVLNALKAYSPTVTRISGADRYATSAAISKATFSPGVSVAYVANGTTFPDALSGAAAAGKTGSPVLLAAANGITSEVKAELVRLKPKTIVVLGGTGVVTNNVLNALKAYSPTVTRIGGADRFATSAAISKATFATGVGTVYVANGTTFPDALSGAAAAGKTGSPVLLVSTNGISPNVSAELTRLKPTRIIVLGGTGTISNNVENLLLKYVG
jgi:putative cell wall-binding protein/peptidoglycan/xylan/chitin deacetylase (PgdA/CDA1 family)